MRRRTVSAEIDAPAEVLWALLADPAEWPRWGPTVRSATIDGGGPVALGARGTVTTSVGPTLPFEVTACRPGTSWSWEVAGVSATDHHVEPLGPQRCRVAFGVPWPATPYLLVCRIALRRLERLAAEAERPG